MKLIAVPRLICGKCLVAPRLDNPIATPTQAAWMPVATMATIQVMRMLATTQLPRPLLTMTRRLRLRRAGGRGCCVGHGCYCVEIMLAQTMLEHLGAGQADETERAGRCHDEAVSVLTSAEHEIQDDDTMRSEAAWHIALLRTLRVCVCVGSLQIYRHRFQLFGGSIPFCFRCILSQACWCCWRHHWEARLHAKADSRKPWPESVPTSSPLGYASWCSFFWTPRFRSES